MGERRGFAGCICNGVDTNIDDRLTCEVVHDAFFGGDREPGRKDTPPLTSRPAVSWTQTKLPMLKLQGPEPDPAKD